MVTCTYPFFHTDTQEKNVFKGVTTLDVNISNLLLMATEWQKQTGGYIFLVSQDNDILTFPDKRLEANFQDKIQKDLLNVEVIGRTHTEFQPIVDKLNESNDKLIQEAKTANPADFERIRNAIMSEASDLNQAQAEIRATTLIEKRADEKNTNKYVKDKLVAQFNIASDFLLKQPATVYMFQLPNPQWKMVIVKPLTEINSLADTILGQILKYLLWSIIPLGLLTLFFFNNILLAPLRRMAAALQRMSGLIEQRRYIELKESKLPVTSRNEIGMVGTSMNSLIDRVVENEGQLAEINQQLERKVEERTAELSQTLSQLKSSQVQLVNSEKMAMLGQMVAGVAHEVNTPLGYVKNNVMLTRENIDHFDALITAGAQLEFLLQQPNMSDDELMAALTEVAGIAQALHEENISEDIKQLLDDAIFGADQIQDLVLNLRNFARLDENRVKDVDVRDCIDSSLKIANNVLKGQVTVERHLNEVPKVSCSPSQINQVLLNLVTNAAQAMHGKEDGRIDITTSADAQNVYIEVADNGSGMPPEVVEHIFEPFYTTKGAGEGTGLGLAICSQIIEQHQGTLTVKSAVGQGTTFTIALPIQRMVA